MIRRSLILSALIAATALHAAPAAANPSIVFDVATSRVIESDDPFQRWYPASLSKLMTTYVVFRAIQAGEVTFSSPVRISKAASQLPPSKMGYPPGSVLTLDNALKIIMVKSANDVARSIGESIAGSQAAFAARMNAESTRLGMSDSHWVNQHGLHDEGQYTSVRDLAILSDALRREFPQYADYFSIEGLLADGKEMPSHNNLLARYDGADGMKTGYTCPAGFNLAASATRNGRTLMAIVVGGETVEARDEKAAELLSRGFASAPGAGPTIAELKRTETGANVPVNMFEQLCSKEVRAARAKKYKELVAAVKAGKAVMPQPIYSADLSRPRRLVPIQLGGAQGPAAKAMASAEAADVPIPTWRPDMPVPGLRTAQQGDADMASQ
ncbi:D-alanyl-D-alanine carboxypeptidase family protein [Mesorhizobium sp. LHD-90]|uniref:D-alanyl-D-alanine carboxypeptidase family protein n=1 Tax=Mesorhizobium sp. LHD-90 TaxID=3071414 RepID=UPI0027E0501A|nr:D-alanyl-D-alanine carboxypeptidase family protein [Mesorhizobium sp. LHD-90]MDQ6432611.1 D-alanyl-D-alanine carboxypeptidase family protein [Mesorhizobium sp. LHD-90]